MRQQLATKVRRWRPGAHLFSPDALGWATVTQPPLWSALPICLCLVACGGSDDSGGRSSTGGSGGSGAGGSGGNTGGAAGAAGSGAASSGCGKSDVPPSGKRSLDVGGASRSYQLYLPSGYDSAKKWPLVLNFHGRTASAFGEAAPAHEFVSKLSEKGSAAGFVVVNPQGLTDSDGSQTWNAGSCCAEDKSRDDVGFVDALLDALALDLCIDEKRVYAAGLSNGGFMSHRLACERAERFAAIAPVAAINGMSSCTPSRPVSVIAFNGTADNLVPYSVSEATIADWVSRNGCGATPTKTFEKGDSRCDTYSGCQAGAEVTFCSVTDGGHTWPGGADLSALGFGKTTQDLSANDALWDFFVKHPLP